MADDLEIHHTIDEHRSEHQHHGQGGQHPFTKKPGLARLVFESYAQAHKAQRRETTGQTGCAVLPAPCSAVQGTSGACLSGDMILATHIPQDDEGPGPENRTGQRRREHDAVGR